MVDVLIVDDHRMVAEGIAQLITGDGNIRVLGNAYSLEDAFQQVNLQKPKVLLLDVAMPDGDGIDAISKFLALSPETRIIILTMYAETTVIQRAMDARASGYLLKNSKAEELVEAIHSVVSGKIYLSKELRDQLAVNIQPAFRLTLREREILRLLSEGNTMKEIASKLYLSFETVHSYTKNLRLKMGCNNTASMVRIAMEQHWI